MSTKAEIKAVAKYQKNNPEKRKVIYTKYRKANPEKVMYWRIKNKATKKNIPFNIELSDIYIPKNCPILGMELVTTNINGKRGANINSPSLDRINPKLGYTKGNIWVISARANTLKSDGTIEEFEKILESLKSLKSLS